LVDIKGKPMIQHVYERASECAQLEKVIVATDDVRIKSAVEGFGGEVVMTSNNHPSGTDRCAEAVASLRLEDNDVVINIQGDEPMIDPELIDRLVALFDDSDVQVGTLVSEAGAEIGPDASMIKVVLDEDSNGMYFSRSPIPFNRDEENRGYLKHIGLYGYRFGTLKKLVQLPIGKLEKAESLEQLRWLEAGYSIRTAKVVDNSFSIDTPEDLERLLKMLS
jgi:3-deoxy-manno-octulosonate cytidylyltransferase (CMP-KDO synthetase)